MISMQTAMQRAKKIPVPPPGQDVTMKIEVAFAFMKLHNLERRCWSGDVLVLGHAQQDSENKLVDIEMKGSSS